jgi:hypothetical protein
MTDGNKFREVVRRNGKKFWEVSAGLGISPQCLYNKIGNATDFTVTELAKFREMFPDVSDSEFNDIFFAGSVTANANV